MVIAHNVAAVNANRQLGIAGKKGNNITEKLSSGYRVNRAADDAAGLSISEKMRKQIRGLDRASMNAQDGISLVQTAEGALDEIQDMLQRMNELAIQAANGTNSTTDRKYIQDEVNQLKCEIDRIAGTAKFNEVYLLSGALGDPAKFGEVEAEYEKYMEEVDRKLFATELTGAHKGERISLDDINARKGLKIIYTEVKDDVNTTQTGSGSSGLSGGSYDTLKNILKTEIVPHAVQALLATYPQAYGYLSGSSIGIGLNLYQDSSTTLASVSVGISGTLNDVNLTYNLSVNVNTLLSGSSVNLTPSIRNNLEVTIVHEMMHAMMDEAHTNGMLGYDGGVSFSPNQQFPGWFREGMAQTAAGGCYNGNDWVNGGLGITGSTSESAISSQVKAASASLGSGTTLSKYGTGYLACMYLGYLANGGGAVTQDGIRRGVDKVLRELRGDSTTRGKSLNDVIRDSTNGQYSSISDFERKFGDAASASFVKSLVGLVGNNGTGGLAAGFAAENGILPDGVVSPHISLFDLDTDHREVTNKYPTGYPALSGGSASKDGTGVDGTSSSGGGTGTGGGGTGTGTGGTGGGGTGTGTGGTPVGPYWKKAALTGGLHLQIGAEGRERMTIYIEGMNCRQIGVQNVDMTTEDSATRSIDMISFALKRVSSQRSTLGAYQNRLEHTIRNLDNTVENTQAAESQIRDADMAEEMVEYSNNQILQQAGQSVLVQATQAADGVMKLLQ